ncbi:MAG: HAMP domain-containing histidine kinase [Clostridia bacterium]|nr:HAMP domain-containing histidine kinase [Clostridia bacterium]
MFARIMAVVLAVILLLTGVLSGIGWIALQNQQTEAVQQTLRQEAREIAYLAAQQQRNLPDWGFGPFPAGIPEGDFAEAYLQRRAKAVYEEYGAYILVVDRNGRIMDNKNTALADNPAFAAMIDVADVNAAMSQVLQGEEIELHVSADGNDYFTVAVPFVQDDVVLGAVFMQTPAQVIEGGAAGLIAPVAGIAVMASLAAGLVLLVMLRGIMKPLNSLTHAAAAMAEGNFAVRVPSTRATREVAELSAAFNTMAEKLSAVEGSRREFVANVSHELRSPITAIRGYVDGMLDGTIPPESIERYLTIVSGETRRLSGLIDELLALSRLERDDAALDYVDFDVCDLLERVFLRRMGDIEARELDVDCDFDPEPCYVRADMARIEQVATNLLDNAIKFTPDGGRINLMVRVTGEVCTVTVTDNGIGILPEDRPRIFERFFTADRAHTSGKGTGLGLSICQRIMEMHGQTIRLLDTQEGAAFAFTLEKGEKPVRSAEAAPESDTEESCTGDQL